MARIPTGGTSYPSAIPTRALWCSRPSSTPTPHRPTPKSPTHAADRPEAETCLQQSCSLHLHLSLTMFPWQINSWFWRKRKELLEQDQKTGSPLPSTSPALHQAISRPSSIPQARHGRHEHGESIIHPAIIRSNNHLRISLQFSSNPSSFTIPPASPTSAPHRPPLLIRCRLRPLAERVVHRSLDREEDQSSEPNRNGFLPGSPLALGASPSYSRPPESCEIWTELSR
ncbi:hypothetical protein PtA15_6A337 [Puccinia triticina]|uniref:Homeobox domain-containing protein n=1 Tax=Puccinia triticina TaxID=208348 RepID=A0ABY7CMY2_9BASI|nr:uncharacterized protein PtA15_6A337 [Puccinia triticina]WAQ85708.1 hypothetical protein PtA15_6A337 [Puccinia triticina]